MKTDIHSIRRKRRDRALLLVERLNVIDDELAQIDQELRNNQPKRPGSITLGFFGCGNDCLGCPHPRWQVWGSPRTADRNVRERVLVKHIVENAAKRVRRTGAFAEHAPTVRKLIARADKLRHKRATILTHLGAAEKALWYQS